MSGMRCPCPTTPPPPSPPLPPAAARREHAPVSPPRAPVSPPPPESTLFPAPANAAPADVPLDLYDDVYFDEQALTALEKIYLFSRSKALVHRVFISRSLHTFLADVSPLDAVEYVLPLLNALATDQEIPVKEALAASLIHVMWWFFQTCQLIDYEPPDEPHNPPLLSVQTFTPILGSLLIDPSTLVCGPARLVVVESLNRLRAHSLAHHAHPNFGPAEWEMLEREIIYHVVIGIGRLDGPLHDSPTPSSPDSPLRSLTRELHPPPPTASPRPGSPDPSAVPAAVPHTFESDGALRHSPGADGGCCSADKTADGGADADDNDGGAEQAAVGRCTSMSLIAAVTAHATLAEETTRAFTAEVLRVARDPLYWVRREASFALGALAKVVPDELVHPTLLPLLATLTRDSIWHVRLSATFALPAFLTRLEPSHRRALALDTLRALAADVAPAVRSGVLEVLGEVIYTFHEDTDAPPAELVQLFVGPAPPLETDASRELITSFNYPAVALSLGPHRWSEIREYYLTLAHSPHLHVRRTVASGLGEIARILGGPIARQDLLGVWEALVHDAEDGETRLRALRGLGLLAQALEDDGRWCVVAGLGELWLNWLEGWRERECVAAQLAELAAMVRGQEEVVCALLGRALVDGVAAVREAGIAALAPVLRAFGDRPHVVEGIRHDLQCLARGETCRQRATYVACCHALVANGTGVEEAVARGELWDSVLRLSEDPVVDVRIGVARLISAVCRAPAPLDDVDVSNNASTQNNASAPDNTSTLDDIVTPRDTRFTPPDACVREALRRLHHDAARDVRAFVEGVEGESLCVRTARGVALGMHDRGVCAPDGGMCAWFSRPPPPRVGRGAEWVGGGVKEAAVVGEGLQGGAASVDGRDPS